MTLDNIHKILLRRAKPYAKKKGSSGVTAWCIEHGVNKSHVSDFMNGKRLPQSDLLEALKLEWRVVPKRVRS